MNCLTFIVIQDPHVGNRDTYIGLVHIWKILLFSVGRNFSCLLIWSTNCPHRCSTSKHVYDWQTIGHLFLATLSNKRNPKKGRLSSTLTNFFFVNDKLVVLSLLMYIMFCYGLYAQLLYLYSTLVLVLHFTCTAYLCLLYKALMYIISLRNTIQSSGISNTH